MSDSVLDSIVGLPVIIGVVLALALLVVIVASTRRHRQEVERANQAFSELSAALRSQQTTLEMLDQRFGQLQNQINQDALQLRDQITDRLEETKFRLNSDFGEQRNQISETFGDLRERLAQSLAASQNAIERRHTAVFQQLGEGLQKGFKSVHEQLDSTLGRSANEIGTSLDRLSRATDERLREISGQVDRRLSEGFEKTTATFTDIVKRLAVIDEAQKKITALSSDVVGLQNILADKRSRGAFGEVQLAALVGNVLPAAGYALQHTLPNDRVADCMLFLPEPTGAIAVDSKFPLESYRLLSDLDVDRRERQDAERQFKKDIRKHIRDIADRYIIPGVTSDGAVMFIPAEAVFAEIQAHHTDLVEEAQRARVWLTSPTTLWAILNTACSVLKDAATREQVDIIQEHLALLGKDFQRFRDRMDQLARHINQANEDVQKVHTSARKISDRFEKIERVELDSPTNATGELQNND